MENLAKIMGGDKSGSHRWETISALLGWIAAFSLVGWLIAPFFGMLEFAQWLLAFSTGLISIVLKRDFRKVIADIARKR